MQGTRSARSQGRRLFARPLLGPGGDCGLQLLCQVNLYSPYGQKQQSTILPEVILYAKNTIVDTPNTKFGEESQTTADLQKKTKTKMNL